MVKMSCKEFKEAINKSGMDFNIWGFEGILNILSSYYYQTAEEYKKEGKEFMAKCNLRRANILLSILEERGYYND